jgi:hypothetical protein
MGFSSDKGKWILKKNTPQKESNQRAIPWMSEIDVNQIATTSRHL